MYSSTKIISLDLPLAHIELFVILASAASSRLIGRLFHSHFVIGYRIDTVNQWHPIEFGFRR